MAAYITIGAKTDHGGTVITGSAHTLVNGIPVARKGDKVQCKKCKKVVTIVTGDPAFVIDGAPVARAGDITSCGSKLIAVQQAFAESDFDVGGIEPPAPLQFPKSNADQLFSSSLKEEKLSKRYKKQIIFEDENGNPYCNIPYIAFFPSTQILNEGMTDEQGMTEEFVTDVPEDIIVHLVTEEMLNLLAISG